MQGLNISISFKNFIPLLTFVVFSLSLLVNTTAYAMSAEQRALFNKNILYYDLACSDILSAPDIVGEIDSVYMRGDSITAGADKFYDLEGKFQKEGITATATGSGGGTVSTGGPNVAGQHGDLLSGIDALERDKDKVSNVDAVVVAYGTNNYTGSTSAMESEIRKMVNKIREINKSAHIFWVNIKITDTAGMDRVNKAIENLSTVLDYTVIDFASSNIPLGDYAHPAYSEAGHGKWGELIAKGVADASSGEGLADFEELDGLNLAGVAKKYNLQSVAVRELGSPTSTSDNANVAPESVASLIKLVIADAFLSTNPDLTKKIDIKGSHLYGGGTPQGTPWDPKAGESFTLEESLINMLAKSSNTQTNVIMEEMGGPNKVGQVARSLNYNSTTIGSYLKFNGSSRNSSTAGDLTNAMNKIFMSGNPKYKIAQQALRDSSYNFGLNSTANKWGGHSEFTGNVGLFSAADKDYVITVLLEEKWQDEVLPDFPGTRGTQPSPSVNKVKNATNDILKGLEGENVKVPEGCACPNLAVELSGENPAVQVYNFLINEMDLTPAQVSGIIGNLMRESGGDNYDLDPTVKGVGMCDPDCYGIAQWGTSRWGSLEAWARSKGKDPWALEVQAEFIKKELEDSPAAAVDGGNGLNLLKAVSGDDASAASKASRIFDENFERSTYATEDNNARDQNAARFFNEYVKGGGLTGGAPQSNGNCSGGGAGEVSGQLIWPVPKENGLSGCWNEFRSYYNGGAGGGHSGIDIAAPRGTQVIAADGGKVELARDYDGGGFGVVVIISHGDGLRTLYAHMIDGSLTVKEGDMVDQGQKIGQVNNTGHSYGDHLHFNVQKPAGEQGTSATTTNPLDYLPDDGRSLGGCMKGPKGGPSGYSGATGYDR